MKKGIIVSLLLMVPLICSAQENSSPFVDSTQLRQTVVAASMEENIVEGKNILFCSTFQLAWDQLIDDIVKEPLQLAGNPVTAQMLNKRLTGKEDISQDCYLAMAGINKDGIVEKITTALKDKFNTAPGIDLRLDFPDDILTYAFLQKDLKFNKDFESLEQPIMFNGKTPVKAFGIEVFTEHYPVHQELRKQLEILDFNNRDDFIIRLKSTSPKDEIILAKVSPGKTLLETIDSVSSRITARKQDLQALNEAEFVTLQIPKLNFNLIHSFSELVGKDLLNAGFKEKDYFIKKAVQAVRFRLDEKGVFLRSEAMMYITMGLVFEPMVLIFDKPFLLCLKEKGAKYPYFALWVDNEELLLRK